LDKANYALIDETNLNLTLLSNNPTFFDGNKVVKIELTEEEFNKMMAENGPHLGLFVQKVKDLAGNPMPGTAFKNAGIKNYNDPDNKPKIEKIEVVAKDKALVYYDQYLKRVDRKAFLVAAKVNDEGNPVYEEPASIEVSEKDGKTVVTLILGKNNTEFAADLTDAAIEVKITEKYKLLNIFDVEANEDEIKKADDDGKMIDKIAPSVDKDSSTAKGNEITLVYDEAIDIGSVSTLTFEVADRNVTSVGQGDSEKEIKITVDDDPFVENAKLKVTQKHVIEGADGNESKFDSIEITVKGGI
jgi:hypothetical protein